MTIIKTILLCTLVVSILFSFSCKTPKETDDLSTLTKEMELQKNPCFGKCPYFVMTIYKGGIVSYDGKKFVEKFGLYTKKLSKSEYKAIKNAFKEADLWALEDSYSSNIPDIPKTRISHFKKGKNKTIIGDSKRPEAVKALEKKLDAIADSDGWTVRSIPDVKIQDYYITDELIISLKPGVDAKEWIKKYKDWNMVIEKSISPNRNLWLFKYDTPDLTPAQVMNLLSIDDAVIVLEFNKEVESRDRGN